MSTIESPPSEFLRLLSDLLDATLDDRGRAALRQMLRDNEFLQDYYRNVMAVHVLLHLDFGQSRQILVPRLLCGTTDNWHDHDSGNLSECAGVIAQIDEELDRRESGSHSISQRAAKRKFWRSSQARIVAAIAAVGIGVILTTVLLPMRQMRRVQEREAARQEFVKRDMDGVAVLAHSADAIWGTAWQVYDVGGQFSTGRFKLNRGIVQLEFFSGATVVVEAPADFELESSMRMICHLGRVRANVPSQAHGFTIETPNYSAVDLGTEFTVQVDNDGESEIHVLEGEVELWDRQSEEAELTQLLTTGRGIRSMPNGELSSIADTASDFLSSEQVLRLSQAELQKRFEGWKQFSNELRQDPRALVYYGFDGHDPWERVVRNESSNDDELLDGAIVGCHWTTGRWKDKQALEFKRTSDRVRLNVPGEFESLTFAAWVRIEGLERWLSSIMLTDGQQLGEVHWQMTELGQLMLGVKAEADQSHDFYSPSILSPRDLGRWVHLACVYDGEEGFVMHYLDGEMVSREAIQIPTTLRIGAAEIGNWVPEDLKDNRVRSLNGRVDEFAILNEALSGEEIHSIYAAGKPQ